MRICVANKQQWECAWCVTALEGGKKVQDCPKPMGVKDFLHNTSVDTLTNNSLTLKMEEVYFSKVHEHLNTTQCRNPKTII